MCECASCVFIRSAPVYTSEITNGVAGFLTHCTVVAIPLNTLQHVCISTDAYVRVCLCAHTPMYECTCVPACVFVSLLMDLSDDDVFFARRSDSSPLSGAGMVVDWEQETGLLMTSGDVRVIRIWDTEREMKVQVGGGKGGVERRAYVSSGPPSGSQPSRRAHRYNTAGDGLDESLIGLSYCTGCPSQFMFYALS